MPEVTRADIKRFLQDIADGKSAGNIKTMPRGRAIVRGGKGTATRTVGLLGGIFSFAVDSGMIRENPVHNVKRYPDKKVERFLKECEFEALGKALSLAEERGENSSAIAILRLLVLTGARKREIEALKWIEVDFERGYLRLGDSKTGQKSIPLNRAAIEVLKAVPRFAGHDYVFPSHRGFGHYVGTPKVWSRIRSMAGLDDVRLHDFRHSFASVAVSYGASLPLIGAMLGHTNSATTMRYAHLHDDPVRAACESVGERINSSIARR